METYGSLIGALIVIFMILTSGRREDKAAAFGFVRFHAKAAVFVIGLVLLINLFR